jgi:hypothetical protein
MDDMAAPLGGLGFLVSRSPVLPVRDVVATGTMPAEDSSPCV